MHDAFQPTPTTGTHGFVYRGSSPRISLGRVLCNIARMAALVAALSRRQSDRLRLLKGFAAKARSWKNSGYESVYEPLDDKHEEIRVCTILPASYSGEEIKIELHTLRLGEVRGSYRSLSYAWGDQSKLLPIILDGRPHMVTRNLFAVLCRLRARDLGENLWIDQLCINQTDDAEKTQQVRLMPSIFAGAREVLIGIDDDDPCPLRSGYTETSVGRAIEALAADEHLNAVPGFYAADSDPTDEQRAAGDSLLKFLDADWFKRSWTVQEVCLAQEARLLCSFGLIEWSVFTQAFRNWNKHRHRKICCADFATFAWQGLSAACHQTYCHVLNIKFTKRGLENGQDILRPLLQYQHLTASDLRDKVYAFYGLHTMHLALPSPDYRKSFKATYTALTMWLLDTPRLTLPFDLDLRKDGSGLPSWVIDWSVGSGLEPNYARMRLNALDAYDAAKGLEKAYEYVSNGVLKTTGAIVDQVQFVSESAFALDSLAGHNSTLSQWKHFAALHGHTQLSPPGVPFNHTFCRILLAGCVEGSGQARKAKGEDFDSLNNFLLSIEADPQHVADAGFERRVMESHLAAVLKRRMFVTSKGRLGIGPQDMKQGDTVWLLPRGRAPFIMRGRRRWRKNKYSVIGHAYLDGVMQGEAMLERPQLQLCLIT